MKKLIKELEKIEDKRQETKIIYPLTTLLGIIVIGILGECEDYQDIEMFAEARSITLSRYLYLPKDENDNFVVPSHDTYERIIKIIDSSKLNEILIDWYKNASKYEEEKIHQIINIDGKTACGSGNKNNKALHIVSAWSKEEKLCLGQIATEGKGNEIQGIMDLLEVIKIEKQIITIDAIGTQETITKKIKEKKADYVLAVKENQPNTFKDIRDYFDTETKKELEKTKNYKKTVDKNRGQIEIRKYYQTRDMQWLNSKGKWEEIQSIGMVEKTIEKDGKITEESRYYISSLEENIGLFEEAVRGHWSIENNLHWQLDVTFREDDNRVIDKNAVLNLNIIRKFCLSMLNIIEFKKKYSNIKKRKAIILDLEKYIPQVFGY